MGPSERQSRILWTSVTALAVGILLGLIGLLLWGLGWLANRLSSVILPLAVAGVLAFVLDPLVDHFEQRTKSRMKAVWMVFMLALLIALALAGTVLPRLIAEVESFAKQVPAYIIKVRDRVDSAMQNPPKWIPGPVLKALQSVPPPLTNVTHVAESAPSGPPRPDHDPNAKPTDPATPDTNASGSPSWNLGIRDQVVSWITKSIPRLGAWLLDQLSKVASVASLLAGLALVPVYLFYFLLEKRGIQNRWREFLPLRESRVKEEMAFVLSSINDCLIVFFRGQVLVAACVGTILAIGFSIIGLNYALLLGVMAGVLGIVPYLGVALSIIPAVTIAIAQFGDFWHPVAVLGVFALAQMLEGFVISPRIIGDRVGLHPLTIIIAVMVGTTLFGGILGGVLAIPLTAVLRTLMFRYVWVGRRPTHPTVSSS